MIPENAIVLAEGTGVPLAYRDVMIPEPKSVSENAIVLS